MKKNWPATYADAFNSDLGSIRFFRDTSGKIISLSIGSSRVWDIRFARVEPAAKAAFNNQCSLQVRVSSSERHSNLPKTPFPGTTDFHLGLLQ